MLVLKLRSLCFSREIATRNVSFEVAHFQARRAVTALAGGVNRPFRIVAPRKALRADTDAMCRTSGTKKCATSKKALARERVNVNIPC